MTSAHTIASAVMLRHIITAIYQFIADRVVFRISAVASVVE